ncbi:hypothetical protein BESB_036370 [Besnoitia besnoiti]|uniref:RAP domain-containing protein n=1 Tax=Besnoitia besnoiti TaxID=94643 RepID=A0A2A9MH01_BESBE|nr:hypothetical protein BESB_036370 [Besnoitia besnoiti]PFH37179.1 hypothetical protein BESB_036370 [Besnoitia besnoiti]
MAACANGCRLGGRPQTVFADSAAWLSRRCCRPRANVFCRKCQELRKSSSRTLPALLQCSVPGSGADAAALAASHEHTCQSAARASSFAHATETTDAVVREGSAPSASPQKQTSSFGHPAHTHFAVARSTHASVLLNFSGSLTHRRFYSEAKGQTAALATMQDPVEVLNFFAVNELASTHLLVSCLRRVSALCDKRKPVLESVSKDERLQKLIQVITQRADDCDARCLVDLCWAVWGFRAAPDVVEQLMNRMANVIVRRENAFTPKQLGTIAFTFSWFRGTPTDTVADFVLAECVKLLPEMEPFHVTLLFGSLRRMRCLNRDVANLMIEKLTDDVDRFTSDDVVGVLRALAANSITRGFLLRRVATLVFDNMDSFTPKQLASILNSLSLLRFLTVENGEELLSRLRSSLYELPATSVAEILEALTILNFPRPEAVRTCIDLIAEKNGAVETEVWLRDHMVIVAHAVIQFQLYDKNPVVKPLLEEVFRSRVNSSRTHHRVEEIIHALELEKASPRVDVPPNWRAMVDQANREEQARLEYSGLQNELTLVLDSLRGKFQLQIQKNQPAGPYNVQFLDDETKICLEIDYPCCRTPHIIKGRHLKQLGYRYLLVDCWQWRRLRSEAEQTVFLKQLLSGPLLELGRLESDEPEH